MSQKQAMWNSGQQKTSSNDSDLPPPRVVMDMWPRAPRNGTAEKKPEDDDDKQHSFRKLTTSFLEGTSAHGLPKVVHSGSWLRKAVWISMIVGAFAYFCYQTTTLFTQYFDYPIAVRIDLDTRQSLEFPAVTVCNMNMMRKSQLYRDSRYKELVYIDDDMQYAVMDMLGMMDNNTESRRKRRDLGGEINDNGEHWNEDGYSEDASPVGRIPEEFIYDDVLYMNSGSQLGTSNSAKVHQWLRANALSGGKLLSRIEKMRQAAYRSVIREGKTPGLKGGDPAALTQQWRAKAELGKLLRKGNDNDPLKDTTEGITEEEASSGGIATDELAEDRLIAEHPPQQRRRRSVRRRRQTEGGSGDWGDDFWDDQWEEEGMVDDDMNWDMFEFSDYGFGNVADDYEFLNLMHASKTEDYSDLVEALKPTIEDLNRYGHQAKDFILQCSFDKRNCSHWDFKKSYNPTYGLCYTFNHGTQGASNRSGEVKNTSKFGSRYGLRLTLDIEYDEYVGLFSHKTGARIAIHPHDVTAFPDDYGISASPGRESEVGVSMEIVQRQPDPHPSNCTSGENHPLLYDGNYTITACAMTCLQDKMKAMCNCVDKMVVSQDVPRCSLTNMTQEGCRQRVHYLHDSGKLGCDCPPPCYDMHYKTTLSQADWPSTPYMYIMAHSLVYDKYDTFYTPDIEKKIRDNLVHIQVYMEDPTVVTIEEYPSYPWDRLLADVGGLLGLFIGVSALTAIELVEFIFDAVKVGCKKCDSKRKTKVRVLPPATHAQGEEAALQDYM